MTQQPEEIRPSKLHIIARLWRHVSDLLLIIRETGATVPEETRAEIGQTEAYCRAYADCDDDELYALDVARAARKLPTDREVGRG